MALLEHDRRISTAEYERMAAAGEFDEGPRVELLDGRIVEMSPQGPTHVDLVSRLIDLFARRVPQLRAHAPLSPEEGWMPEPDIAVVAQPPDGRTHPATALLVVEVSVTSQARDRRKAATYARAGVQRYWLLDVPGERVFEYLKPGPDGYEVVHTLSGDDVLDAHVEGVPTTTVAELLAR